MQLLAICLYSHDGRMRPLRFEPGALNVISGLSRTGKTELIKIIDFCAGRKTPQLAPGPITRKVSWFAAVFLAADGRHVIVARPQPRGKSASSAMLSFGNDGELPSPGDLAVNSNARSVRRALDGLLGLGKYELDQWGGTRDRLRASVGHAIQFCLQSQTELMTPEYLFHRGGDEDVANDFRDLFPYFLGAIDEEVVARRRAAAETRRRLRQTEQRLTQADARVEATTVRDRALLAEAVEVGLIDAGGDQVDNARAMLGHIASAPVAARTRSAPDHGDQRLSALRRDVETARAELRELRERRAALRRLDEERGGHLTELAVQVGRLGVVSSLTNGQDADANDICVVCGSALDEPDLTLQQLVRDFDQLHTQLTGFAGAAADVGPAESRLADRISEAQRRLNRARVQLEAAIEVDAASHALARAAEAQAFIRGAINEHLKAAANDGAAARTELRERVRALSEELTAVEPGTKALNEREEVEARLDGMAAHMTSWARQLDLEAAGDGLVRIDRSTLNVSIGTSRGRVDLAAMGSGANHVGYHLVAHLALHQHFVQERRPVPRFIVFDQPSLPYFPKGVLDLDDAAGDVDWQAVRSMFTLTDQVVTQLDGTLQVIITDHAGYPGEQWYDDALVEDWHTGTKLVPDEWPERE